MDKATEKCLVAMGSAPVDKYCFAPVELGEAFLVTLSPVV